MKRLLPAAGIKRDPAKWVFVCILHMCLSDVVAMRKWHIKNYVFAFVVFAKSSSGKMKRVKLYLTCAQCMYRYIGRECVRDNGVIASLFVLSADWRLTIDFNVTLFNVNVMASMCVRMHLKPNRTLFRSLFLSQVERQQKYLHFFALHERK